MIADVYIEEKSFGDKVLILDSKFTIRNGEKVGFVGKNGAGKSTLLGILSGGDVDFTGNIKFMRGLSSVYTSQEHYDTKDINVLEYILDGLPEYAELKHIIDTYPEKMHDSEKMMNEYSEALERFGMRDFYTIEEKVERDLEAFGLDVATQKLATLSGGEKRLVEVVKVMNSNAHLALIDEPTNHMDYVAKNQFIDWISNTSEAMLIITHDRDVLRQVDRIIELKDRKILSYKGNYDDYLRQNTHTSTKQMGDFELNERRKTNLKQEIITYRRLKEKARNPSTIRRFKSLESKAIVELAKLEELKKPTFWIDKKSTENLEYKSADRYEKYKSKTIKLDVSNKESKSKQILISGRSLSLGYEEPLFSKISFDVSFGDKLEFRGRNGAGKSTLIKAILSKSDDSDIVSKATLFNGEINIEPNTRIGVYEQEISEKYLDLKLKEAVEKMYFDRNLALSETGVQKILREYLFTSSDFNLPIRVLSGGQKARFQVISMLANDPQVLILDEPTNHLDLPSIEELESALEKYSGAVIYVSHDSYFCEALKGQVILVGKR